MTAGADDPEGAGRHAVDTPVGVAMLVADGNGEPAIVGPDDVKMSVGGTGDVQPGVLAGIVGLILFHVLMHWI